MKRIVSITVFLAVNLAAGTIADYRMDECSWNGTAGEVKDQTGSYDAKVDIANTTTTTALQRVINRSGAFNQGNDNSAVALPPALLNGRNTFTFTAWVYPTQNLSSKNTFLSAENGDGDYDMLLFRIDGSNVNLKYAANGTQNNFTLTSADIPANQWSFIALSKSDTQACVAINDSKFECISIDSAATPLDLSDPQATLLLAQDSTTPGSYYINSAFPGYMDEVKFFDTNLSRALQGPAVRAARRS